MKTHEKHRYLQACRNTLCYTGCALHQILLSHQITTKYKLSQALIYLGIVPLDPRVCNDV